jgi:hypothetical protein
MRVAGNVFFKFPACSHFSNLVFISGNEILGASIETKQEVWKYGVLWDRNSKTFGKFDEQKPAFFHQFSGFHPICSSWYVHIDIFNVMESIAMVVWLRKASEFQIKAFSGPGFWRNSQG